MFRVRTSAGMLVLFCLAASAGCCCDRKGYILRGDFALELNRVSHLFGRYDDYEMSSGDCDCDACTGANSWGNDGSGEMLGSPEPRLHPVPTRPVFSPNRASPTPAAPPSEEVAPPFDETSAPTSQRRQRYGSTTPRGSQPFMSAQAASLQLNSADRRTRRKPLAPVEAAKPGRRR